MKFIERKLFKKMMLSLKTEDKIMKLLLEKHCADENNDHILVFKEDLEDCNIDILLAAKLFPILETSDFFKIIKDCLVKIFLLRLL